MIDDTWAFKPALEQARAIAERRIKPAELVALYYERIARVDPELNAYVLLTRELAESQAELAREVAEGEERPHRDSHRERRGSASGRVPEPHRKRPGAHGGRHAHPSVRSELGQSTCRCRYLREGCNSC